MPLKQSNHITIEELRQCPEFANMYDYLAQKMIDTIQEFCSIIANQCNALSGEEEAEAGNT